MPFFSMLQLSGGLLSLCCCSFSFISRPHPDEAAAQGASSSWGMWDRWTAILTIGLITEELLRTHVLAYRCSGPVVKAANRAVLLCSTAYLLELPGLQLQAFCLCSAVSLCSWNWHWTTCARWDRVFQVKSTQALARQDRVTSEMSVEVKCRVLRTSLSNVWVFVCLSSGDVQRTTPVNQNTQR